MLSLSFLLFNFAFNQQFEFTFKRVFHSLYFISMNFFHFSIGFLVLGFNFDRALQKLCNLIAGSYKITLIHTWKAYLGFKF